MTIASAHGVVRVPGQRVVQALPGRVGDAWQDIPAGMSCTNSVVVLDVAGNDGTALMGAIVRGRAGRSA